MSLKSVVRSAKMRYSPLSRYALAGVGIPFLLVFSCSRRFFFAAACCREVDFEYTHRSRVVRLIPEIERRGVRPAGHPRCIWWRDLSFVTNFLLLFCGFLRHPSGYQIPSWCSARRPGCRVPIFIRNTDFDECVFSFPGPRQNFFGSEKLTPLLGFAAPRARVAISCA